jgi:hypothetical protein
MGGFDTSGSSFGDPDAPRVVITGLTVMGGVGVVRKIPHEEKLQLREDKRQRREIERRQRREARERRGEDDSSGGGHSGKSL